MPKEFLFVFTRQKKHGWMVMNAAERLNAHRQKHTSCYRSKNKSVVVNKLRSHFYIRSLLYLEQALSSCKRSSNKLLAAIKM